MINPFLLVKDFYRRYRERRIMPLRNNWHDWKLLQRTKGRRLPSWFQIAHLGKILNPTEHWLFLGSVVVLVFAVGWLGLKFLLSFRTEVPKNGGTYAEAVVGAPQFINPIFASTNDIDLDITRLVFSGLLRYDAEHRLVPDLAVKYNISNDKKVYDFELRQDALWHDGEKFTARDVVYTIETIQNPAVNSPLIVTFQGVNVEAVDDYHIKFTLREPFVSFLSALTMGILPEHVWFDVPAEQMRLAKGNLQPVGIGPFVFNKLLKDDTGRIYRYELVRFDKFYRRPSYLNGFDFVFYPEYDGDGGAIKAFREQKVQGLSFVPQIWLDKVERKNVDMHVVNLPQYTALFLNQSHAPALKDSDVRRALASAVDKDQILREVLQNNGQLISGPILPGFPGFSADVKAPAFSFSAANELLDKKWTRVNATDYRKVRLDVILKDWDEKNKLAVVASSTDGNTSSTLRDAVKIETEKQLDQELHAAQTFYRKNKSGDFLELTLVTTYGKEYQKIAEMVAGFWENVGIKINLRFVEPKNFSRDVLKERGYDILLYGEIVGADPDPFPFWHSSQIDYPGLNLSRYVNRSTDALIEKMRSGVSEKENSDLYRRFQETLVQDLPAIFLYMPTYTFATIDSVHGIDIKKISHPSDRLSGATDWYMKIGGEWNF